jgi:hypothetical protein
LDEKIKTGAKAVSRKIGEPESNIGSEYETIERVGKIEKIQR